MHETSNFLCMRTEASCFKTFLLTKWQNRKESNVEIESNKTVCFGLSNFKPVSSGDSFFFRPSNFLSLIAYACVCVCIYFVYVIRLLNCIVCELCNWTNNFQATATVIQIQIDNDCGEYGNIPPYLKLDQPSDLIYSTIHSIYRCVYVIRFEYFYELCLIMSIFFLFWYCVNQFLHARLWNAGPLAIAKNTTHRDVFLIHSSHVEIFKRSSENFRRTNKPNPNRTRTRTYTYWAMRQSNNKSNE